MVIDYYCANKPLYHIHLTHANVWESVGKPCSCTQFIKSRTSHTRIRISTASHARFHIRYCKSLQVTRESVSGTTCKSLALCLNVEWNRRFIWWNHYHQGWELAEIITSNKLVIFCIALYYGDTYIICICAHLWLLYTLWECSILWMQEEILYTLLWLWSAVIVTPSQMFQGDLHHCGVKM